jgi:hypothetical protein
MISPETRGSVKVQKMVGNLPHEIHLEVDIFSMTINSFNERKETINRKIPLMLLILVVLALVPLWTYAACVTFELWAEENEGVWEDKKHWPAEFSVWFRLYGYQGGVLKRINNVDYKFQIDSNRSYTMDRKPTYISRVACRDRGFPIRPSRYELLLYENDIGGRLAYDTRRLGDQDDKISDFASRGWRFYEDTIPSYLTLSTGVIGFDNNTPTITNAKGAKKVKSGDSYFQFNKAYVFRNSSKHSNLGWRDILDHKGYVIIRLKYEP